MTALINMFNEQNPDVEIVPTFVNHDDYNQKIVVLASSDSSVMDLVSCDSQATVLNLVTLDGLLPLKDRIEAAGIDMSAYGPIISETLFEDEYYGVPYRQHPVLPVLQQDPLRQEGHRLSRKDHLGRVP